MKPNRVILLKTGLYWVRGIIVYFLVLNERAVEHPKKGGLFQGESGLSIDKSGLQGGLLIDQSGLSVTAQKILQLLEENPAITYDEIATRLGKARSGIAKHIKNLKEKGFIKR